VSSRQLGAESLHHLVFDIGQAEVAAGVALGQRFVVEAEKMQDGDVEVVDVDFSLGDAQAELNFGKLRFTHAAMIPRAKDESLLLASFWVTHLLLHDHEIAHGLARKEVVVANDIQRRQLQFWQSLGEIQPRLITVRLGMGEHGFIDIAERQTQQGLASSFRVGAIR